MALELEDVERQESTYCWEFGENMVGVIRDKVTWLGSDRYGEPL